MGKISNFLKSDDKKLTLMLACTILALTLCMVALLIYWIAGIGSYYMSISILVFGLLLTIPGIIGMKYFYRKKKIRQGKIRTKYDRQTDYNEKQKYYPKRSVTKSCHFACKSTHNINYYMQSPTMSRKT